MSRARAADSAEAAERRRRLDEPSALGYDAVVTERDRSILPRSRAAVLLALVVGGPRHPSARAPRRRPGALRLLRTLGAARVAAVPGPLRQQAAPVPLLVGGLRRRPGRRRPRRMVVGRAVARRDARRRLRVRGARVGTVARTGGRGVAVRRPLVAGVGRRSGRVLRPRRCLRCPMLVLRVAGVARHSTGRASRFWAGVLVGVCGLFKIPSMAIALSCGVTWLACVPARRAAERVGLMARRRWSCPWALAFGWFAAHGATSSFVEGVFVYHRYNAAFIAPPWGGVLVDFGVEDVHRGAAARSRSPRWACSVSSAVARARRTGSRSWIVADDGGGRSPAAARGIPLHADRAGPGGRRRLRSRRHGPGRARGPDAAPRRRRRPRGLAPPGGPRGVRCGAEPTQRTSTTSGAAYRAAMYLRAIQPGSFSMADEEQAASWLRDRTRPRRRHTGLGPVSGDLRPRRPASGHALSIPQDPHDRRAAVSHVAGPRRAPRAVHGSGFAAIRRRSSWSVRGPQRLRAAGLLLVDDAHSASFASSLQSEYQPDGQVGRFPRIARSDCLRGRGRSRRERRQCVGSRRASSSRSVAISCSPSCRGGVTPPRVST